MGRSKVRHEFIAKEAARKITFRKRTTGLWNKLREISTLCGVAACGVIFSNFTGKGKENQPKVEAWPSGVEAVEMLKRMKKLPEKKQKKYKLNHDSLLNARVEKLEEKLKNEIENNQWLEIEWLLRHEDVHMEEALSGGYINLNDPAKLKSMGEKVEELIKQVDEQIEDLENE